MIVTSKGFVETSSVYLALVKNKAKLAYDSISDWLEGKADNPIPNLYQAELSQQIKTQDLVAQQMRALRHEHGSLQFVTFEPKAIFDGDKMVDIQQQQQNRGRQIIEEFMIATNASTARFLASHQVASIRRVVRTPEKWSRIREIAQKYHFVLPPEPDSLALEDFLISQQKADPLRFPDLSLVIIKLMGSGEYIVEKPGDEIIGHFGLAEKDYTHSTAPNRRYPDLITQRMLKAILLQQNPPYSLLELEHLAEHCTEQEDASRKVERHIRKSEAAFYLKNKIGQIFDGLVTGVSVSATWVRIFEPAAEGRIIDPVSTLVVGQKIKVQLISRTCKIQIQCST
jgi:exoribonuclease-2